MKCIPFLALRHPSYFALFRKEKATTGFTETDMMKCKN